VAQCAYLFGERLTAQHESAIAIDKVDVCARLQQRKVFPLAMDVDQMPPYLFQDRKRHRPAIHAADTAARPVDLPAQDQLTGIALQAVCIQQGIEARGKVRPHGKHALHFGRLSTRTHHVHAGSAAE